MKVYFDKDNLISFISNKPSDKKSDCTNVLKSKCKIMLTFSKEEVKDSDVFKLWLRTISNGLKYDLSWNVDYPERPLRPNNIIVDGLDSLRSVYLLNGDDVSHFKNKGIVLVGKVGEEIDILSSLWFDDTQYIKDIFDRVNCWDDLKPYTSPTSDIIVIDNFVMNSEELIEYNLIKILKILCSHSKQQKINIALFVERNNQRNHDYYKQIANQLERKIGEVVATPPNVMIVALNKDVLGEHDRTILTNYKLFASGDTWNYFDSQSNKITRGRHLLVYSLIDKEIKDKADKLLSEIKEVFNHAYEINCDNVYKKTNFKSNYLDI